MSTDNGFTDEAEAFEYVGVMDHEVDAFRCYLDNMSCDWSEVTISEYREFQDAFCGQYYSLKEYAENLVDEGAFGDIPENLVNYIDCDAIANDFRCEGHFVAVGREGTYVFQPA